MTKFSDRVKRWRIKTKNELILYKGGKCERCGYDKIKYIGAFDFHHIDPKQKDFGISRCGCTRNMESLKKEVDKCLLLCANCHREIHDEMQFEKRESLLLGERKFLQDKECPICRSIFKPINKRMVYCTRECYSISSRKIKDRPSKDELLKELETTSYVALGKKYGVSDNAIRKWVR